VAGFVNLAIAQGPPPMPRHRSAMREQWHAMSPEDRQRFRSNAERWLGLPPEERHALRMQEAIRRERLRRDAEAAMRDSGLDLEAERRAQFEQRYFEERRRIDRALRQEIQERRQRELAPVLDELRREFAQPGGTTVPANVRSASPGPTK
jgi:hypothetical protein